MNVIVTLGIAALPQLRDFMEDVADRITDRIQLTTDGHRVLMQRQLSKRSGLKIDYAMLVKIYGASNEGELRYSPASCIGCRTGVLAGDPDPKHISTSFVERQNLPMRMGMRRFTRLSNGFNKKLENHGHMVALYFMHYNFCRVHKTLRVMTSSSMTGACQNSPPCQAMALQRCREADCTSLRVVATTFTFG